MVKGKAGNAPTADGAAGAIAVIATLYGMIFVAMKNGPAMNPAVAVAFTILELVATSNPNGVYTHYLYAYTAGPALGGMIAGLFALLLKRIHNSMTKHVDYSHEATEKGRETMSTINH